MNISDWLRASQTELGNASIDSARLDALILLEDETNKDRGWLLANPDYDLSSDQVDHLANLLSRRTKHEPMAYIRGKSEFYGHTFMVNEDVLVPRPESESIIELLLEIYPELVSHVSTSGGPDNDPKAIKIADIGCGSGALGISAKLQLPQNPKVEVDLIDIDEKARKTAKMNVDLFTLDIPVIESDLLSNTSRDYHVLLCNLPYVPEEHTVNQAAKHEPKIALYSGASGLNHYRALLNQIGLLPVCPLYLLIEALESQHSEIEQLADKCNYKLQKTSGLVLLFANAN